LLGVKSIFVIDLDTIDLTNLNRQFLFRMKDVGRSKAQVAAEFIMNRVSGCVVQYFVGKIQEKDADFYRQFRVVISGLDNIEARRWLNSMLVNLVEYDEEGNIDPSTIIPLIDGGTEGFKGQARVVVPRVTSCFECSLETFPPQRVFPMCTIAETPRLPEHCIAYVSQLEWPRMHSRPLDPDSPSDMQWVFKRALERAERHGIEGVTYFKTLGVVKNIIPAVASTNAVISAVCVAEALKLLTYCGQTLDSYLMFMGAQGMYSPSFRYGQKDSCPVCAEQAVPRELVMSGASPLSALLLLLARDPALQLARPSLLAESTTLYMQRPPQLELALRKNLTRPLQELLESGELLTVTDPALGEQALTLRLLLTP